GRRNFIEVGHDFDLIMAVLENVGFGIHFIRRVGIHAFVAGRRHAALFVKKFDRLERPCRKWATLESLSVGVPILVHVGAQRDEGAFGHLSVLLLPRLEILDRKGMVGILAQKR